MKKNVFKFNEFLNESNRTKADVMSREEFKKIENQYNDANLGPDDVINILIDNGETVSGNDGYFLESNADWITKEEVAKIIMVLTQEEDDYDTKQRFFNRHNIIMNDDYEIDVDSALNFINNATKKDIEDILETAYQMYRDKIEDSLHLGDKQK